MELTEQAARALEALRRGGLELRFVVDEICHSERYRLSVRYRDVAGDEVRLGLLYSIDRDGLAALAEQLASRRDAASRERAG